MSITAEQVQLFEERGYLTGLDIHDAAQSSAIRQAFDALEAREGPDKCEIGLHGRHIDQRFVWELAAEARILDCIAALMGSDILVLSTHFFCKYPQTNNKFVAWHQDVTYWGLEPPHALTAWYAIDESDVENGCMRVIPGSHRQGVVAHGESNRAGNLLSINQEVEADVDDKQAVDLVLKAGQISIHHGHLIHGSNPNGSQRRRCGLTIRFCPPHVKPIGENSLNTPWPAVLARGEDPFKNFGEWKLQFS
jgi:ectoine hydroxylase-related dioxygenase (phytanoyl-CoA dioxygenase family)